MPRKRDDLHILACKKAQRTPRVVMTWSERELENEVFTRKMSVFPRWWAVRAQDASTAKHYVRRGTYANEPDDVGIVAVGGTRKVRTAQQRAEEAAKRKQREERKKRERREQLMELGDDERKDIVIAYWNWKLDRVHVLTNVVSVMGAVGGHCAAVKLGPKHTEEVLITAVVRHLKNRDLFYQVSTPGTGVNPVMLSPTTFVWRHEALSKEPHPVYDTVME